MSESVERHNPSEPPGAAPALRRWLAQARLGGRRLSSQAVNLIYPPSCIACHAATADSQGLCASCWGGMSFITRPYCERLGTPFAVDLGGPLLSPAAMADPPVFARARALCRYEGTARELTHRLKYGDRIELSQAMARMMLHAGQELLSEADLIVPVPLHRARLWSRRFNQSALLARAIAEEAGKPVALDLILRRKRTKPQVGLTRDQRRLNLQGAFRLNETAAPLDGRRVLLIDDVLTTGATANAAARCLLRGGASAVDVLSFARVVPGEG